MRISFQRLGLQLIILFACSIGLRADPPARQPTEKTMQYPVARTTKTVDTYHEREVSDPYRWLEDTESKETQQWIEAENKVTQRYLKGLPNREAMRKRLETLWNYERYGIPSMHGGRYLYQHNDGLQNQSVLYLTSSLESPAQVLLDPNKLSQDGTVALAGRVPSDDGKLLAYGLADGGSDWRTWKVREIATGKDLEDTVRWVKFSSVAWLPDSSGFYYSRYQEPTEGAELTGTNENQTMYFHRIGTRQQEDLLIIERVNHPKWGFSPEVTDDGRYLVVNNWKGSEPQNQIMILNLQSKGSVVSTLIEGFDAEYEFIGSRGAVLYFLTDHQAPKRRVIAINVEQPERQNWKQVIAETDNVLQSVSLFGETFYVNALQDARSYVTRHDLNGKLIDEFQLPGLGSVSGFYGKQDAKETFFSFTNYVTPGAIYRVDLSNPEQANQGTLWRRSEIDLNLDRFVTEQVFCTSKDGTKVPIIITRRKDIELDGSHQTLLYAYGGFNVSLTPSFSAGNAAWVDAGGIYAVANLRGGGEYGRQWREDGMRLKKQNVFNDFIAAAEFLIDQGYTSSNRLGIRGGSNGGLLVGAVMTQRPDLFGACLPAVGVMDMLRYQKFTIGWAWVAEFGSSDEADQIENLLSYSPLHNIKKGTCYPATLITTADRDDRVVPGHSFKFAATLQAAQQCQNPTLIRIETRAGHGAGTPISKRIEEYADLWAFLQENLK